MYIKAIKHICRLRGGSQAQLMTADDGHEYVVKFKGNPQTTRVLANEYLAGHLALTIGLSIPEPVIIHVDVEAINECKIEFQFAGTQVAPTAGLQFGSRLIVDEEVHEWLPSSWIGNIKNVKEFAGVLAFDKWTGNATVVRSCFTKSVLSGSTRQHSLILATVSMPLNGISPIRPFGVTPARKCTHMSSRGTTLNPGYRGLSGVLRPTC